MSNSLLYNRIPILNLVKIKSQIILLFLFLIFANPILKAQCVSYGGTISTMSNTTVCALDGVPDVIDAVTGGNQVGQNYGWLITDLATGTILSNGVMAQNSPTFSPDLEGAPSGSCQIWVIAWNGTLSGATQGANVGGITSTDCFNISNSIDVERKSIEGGTISTTSSTTVCALDGLPDIIDAVAGNDQMGDNYGWLITDAATGTILSPGIVAQNSQTFSPDLEGAPYGTCQIWVISWNGTLTGGAQGTNVSLISSDQCFDLSNSIDVVRQNCNCVSNGGTISTTSSTTVCALDGVPDVIDAVAGNDQVGDNYGWLITDAATGTILSNGVMAQNSQTFSPDLEGAPVGTCQIWIIGWNGNLFGANQGASIFSITSDQCKDFSNPISVVRKGIDGGSISTTSSTTVCALDGLPDVIDAVAGNDQMGDDYGWLITDAATGTILSPGIVALNSPTFSPDLEGAPIGTCQIWVISWNGTLTGGAQGTNVSGISSDQCFDLSNSIDVVRQNCNCITDAGTISTTSSTTVCALDGVADVIDAVAGNNQVGDDYGWLITDAATGTILSNGVMAQNSQTFSPDLEGAPAGTCQIWVISWNGMLSGAIQGNNVSMISSNECFDLSNSIDVERKGIDGGSISTTSSTTVCALDGVPDIIDAVAGNDQMGDDYGWLITDAATGTILSPGIVALNSPTFSPDLEGAPVGTCQIWVISWNGTLTGGAQGTNVSGISSDQCFDLSNSIDVVRQNCNCTTDGGTIEIAGCDLPWTTPDISISDQTFNWTSNPIDISCAGLAKISMDIEGISPQLMEYADFLNIYYELDGGAQIPISENRDGFALKTVSATVSGSSLVLVINGRTSYNNEIYNITNILVEDLGQSTPTSTAVCALDGMPDVIDAVAGNDQVGDDYGWLITDAATGTILSPGVVALNSQTFSPDLEGAPVGTCQIWVISWNGMLSGATQGNNVSMISSNQCFDLSNPIDVERKGIDGGSISIAPSACALPWTTADISISNQTFNWTSNPIDISCVNTATISMDIEGISPQLMEYADFLNIYYEVDGGGQIPLSENRDGFALRTITANVSGSSLVLSIHGRTSFHNEFYNITNILVDNVGPSSPTSTTVCALDGVPDVVDAVAGNDQVGDNYGWVITDAATGTILSPGVVALNSQTFSPDLEGAPVGTCQIWVISWNGTLSGGAQGTNVSMISSDQCFALSNPIDVVREDCTIDPCNDIDFNDFEAGYGIWNDGGYAVRRNIDDAPYANGDYAIRLRDNDGINSSMFTDVLALGGYQEVSVDFSYYTRSMETGEDFWFEASINGGASWISLKRWVSGYDFLNNQRYTGAITIQGNFTNNTRFRIRCDASSKYDYVYIDDIHISACPTPSHYLANIVDMDNVVVEEPEQTSAERVNPITNIELYPNPLSDNLTVEFEAVDLDVVQMQILDFTGRLIHEENVEITSEKQIVQYDAQELAPGAYLVYLVSGKTRVIKKFIVAR